MTKKPNIILLRDIVLPFEQANKELALIKQDIDNSKEQRQIKSLFLYSYAIFESTRDCNLNCVSKEKNIIFTNTVFL